MKGPTQKIHCTNKQWIYKYSKIIIEISILWNVEIKYIYLIIPSLALVVDNCSSKAPSRVNSGSGDRNRRQMNHENCKSDWQRCQNLITKSNITSIKFRNIRPTLKLGVKKTTYIYYIYVPLQNLYRCLNKSKFQPFLGKNNMAFIFTTHNKMYFFNRILIEVVRYF